MEERIREVVQAKLDELKSGLEIINVNTKDIHPPISVAASYEEVIAAMQEKEQKINQATGYSASAIPEARGWAVKTRKQVESYVLEKKAKRNRPSLDQDPWHGRIIPLGRKLFILSLYKTSLPD